MRRMFGNAFQSTTPPTTTSSPADPDRSKSVSNSGPLRALDDEFLPTRLPFGGTRSARSSRRLPSTRAPGSKSTAASLVGSSVLGSPRDPNRSPASPRHPFSGADLKSKMMLQLLSSQAMIEASDFQILPFSRVEQLKKEQAALQARHASITRKIVLEEKIRDATLTMIESGATEDEPEVQQSTQRLHQLRRDQKTVHTQLSDIRTQLLQHLSAVLSLSLTKTEQQQPSSRPSSLRPTQSPAPTLRQGSESPPLPDSATAFDGPHLFANSTSGSLSSPVHFASKPLIDTGQLQGYEKKIADQTDELSGLRAEIISLRTRAEGQETQRSSEAAREMAKLRTQAASLAKELERSQINLGGEQQILANRAREAENRSQAAEDRSRELEVDLDRLRMAVETAEEAKDSVRSELVALQGTCAQLAEQRTDLEQQRQQQVDAFEREKAVLTAELNRLRVASPPPPVLSAEWDALVTGLNRLGPLANSTLTQLLARRPSSSNTSERVKWIGEFVTGLETYFAGLEGSQRAVETKEEATTNERTRLLSRVDELEAQLVDLKRSHEDATTTSASSETKEVERLKEELAASASNTEVALESLKSQLEEAQQATEAVKVDLANAREELTAMQKAHEDAGAVERTLRDLFRTLPPVRARLEPEGDLSSFKAIYEGTAEPVAKKSGLVGLFGLGKRAPTPVLDEVEYSLDGFIERAKGMVESDKRLIERLLKHESEKEVYKANALRATKLAEESREALKTYQQQVKELEERLEYADTQSATMLERFNDLMESEEKANGLARRAESATAPLQAQITSLKEEAEALRKELSQAEEDAEDVRRRARAAEDEVGSLKVKIRQAERNK